MTSSLALEQPGTWRPVGVAVVFALVAAPTVPLFWHALTAADAETLGTTFWVALGTSVLVAAAAAAIALIVGLPLGVLTALYEFRGRRLLIALVALPLLVPSFLWSIGWWSSAAHVGPRATALVAGVRGCVLVSTVGILPLVLLAAYAATTALSGSQVEVARLAGGEPSVIEHASRNGAVPALLAALLGGVLTLADAGPGQIFGVRTAAAEMLTSFAAQYDFVLAGRQCAVLSALVLVLSAPLAIFAAPRLAREMLARQARRTYRVRHRTIGAMAAVAATALVSGGTLAPLVGLVWPLFSAPLEPPPGLVRAAQEAVRNGHLTLVLLGALSTAGRTAANTIIYAGGAGAVATLLSLILATCIGRDRGLRTVGLGMALVVFCWPPAAGALGLVQLAAAAPAWADPLLRSRLTVCLALGLRLFPVAAVLAMRAWGATPASWAFAGAVHGVRLTTYVRRVVFPALQPALGVAMLLVSLLAMADVGTVLLLHPPGQGTLPLAIFTVMANAPETVVAALSLVYVAAAAALLAALWAVGRTG